MDIQFNSPQVGSPLAAAAPAAEPRAKPSTAQTREAIDPPQKDEKSARGRSRHVHAHGVDITV